MLKETIERICRIPRSQQVLLISGGEILQNGTKVCSYSSGTDNNPIFMFSTNKLQEKPVAVAHKNGKLCGMISNKQKNSLSNFFVFFFFQKLNSMK